MKYKLTFEINQSKLENLINELIVVFLQEKEHQKTIEKIKFLHY